jgi:uncharacterized protein YjbI with pentapeptide repeats
MDNNTTYLGGRGPNNPLSLSGINTAGEFASLTKALKGPDKDRIWSIYSNDEGIAADELLSNVDFQGMDTSSFSMTKPDLSNSNVTGAQLTAGGQSGYYRARNINMQGFNPPANGDIAWSYFNNSYNVDPASIVRAQNFEYITLTGAKKADGSSITKENLEQSIEVMYSGSERLNKLAQLNTIIF